MKIVKFRRGDTVFVKTTYDGVVKASIIKRGLFCTRVMRRKYSGLEVELVPNWRVWTQEEGQKYIDAADGRDART